MQEPELGIESDSVDKNCVVCFQKKQTTKASVYCKTCKQFQCTECHSFHKVFPGLQDHVVVDADSLEQVLDLNGLDICSVHNKGLEFLCNDHNVLCCGTCVIVDHRKCGTVEEIKQIASSDLIAKEHELKSKIDDHKTRCASLNEHLQASKISIETQVDKLKKEYDNFEEKINNMLIRSRKKFEEDISTTKSNLICSSDADLAAAHRLHESTQDANRMIEEFAKHGDPVQKFICYHHIENHTIPENTAVLTNQAQSMTKTNISLEFNTTFQTFIDPDKLQVSGETNARFWKPQSRYHRMESKMGSELVELKVSKNLTGQKEMVCSNDYECALDNSSSSSLNSFSLNDYQPLYPAFRFDKKHGFKTQAADKFGWSDK